MSILEKIAGFLPVHKAVMNSRLRLLNHYITDMQKAVGVMRRVTEEENHPFKEHFISSFKDDLVYLRNYRQEIEKEVPKEDLARFDGQYSVFLENYCLLKRTNAA